MFPKFSFTTENVPLGDSIPLCLGIHWGNIERGKHYGIMKPVQGFGKCSSMNEKFIWNDGDSSYGVDIPTWKQTAREVGCSDEDCPDYCKRYYNGAFVNGVNKHICYSYEILDSICIVVKYDKLRDEYFFRGGCYPGNQTYKMIPANFGEEQNFYNVKIEVRDYSDPIVQAGEWTDYGYNFGHFWGYLSFILKLLCLSAIGVISYVAYDVYMTKNKYKGISSELVKGEEDKNNQGENYGV